MVDAHDRLAARGGDRRGGRGGDALRARLLPGRGDGAPPRRCLGRRPRARRCAACRPGRWWWRSPDGSAWDAIGKAYKRLELGDSEYLPAFFARWPRAVARGAVSDASDDEPRPATPSRFPLTGDLDLHSVRSRARSRRVVEEYVRACRERGVLRAAARARARARRAARRGAAHARRSMPEVVTFADAPAAAGGWGATSGAIADARRGTSSVF